MFTCVIFSVELSDTSFVMITTSDIQKNKTDKVITATRIILAYVINNLFFEIASKICLRVILCAGSLTTS